MSYQNNKQNLGDHDAPQEEHVPGKEDYQVVPQQSPPGGNTKETIPHHSVPGEHLMSEKKKGRLRLKELVFFSIMQVVCIILYGTCTTYGQDVTSSGNVAKNTIQNYYPMFQDVHVMIFIGFGFLMTFLKYHSWSSVMFNFFVATWAIEWGILNVAFFHSVFGNHWSKVPLDVTYLIEGDFAAGAVLISFGAVLGKVNSFQLLIMATIEIICYACNVGLAQKEFKSVDMGGSMLVHTFGAFFGMACAYAMGPKDIQKKNLNIGANYNSNMFAAIGTLFLFMFWPSFNGALATGNSQHRVVVNTVLALSASTMGAFFTSALVNKGQFKMEDCLNATLTGGVIIGSSSDLVAAAWLSILIGWIGGTISTLGFSYVTGALANCGLHDTCGVTNLHGFPGIVGALIGAISAGAASKEVYGDNINDIFPAMKDGRTQSEQAGFQLACLASTLGISIVGGLITGAIIKCEFFEGPKPEHCFDDEMYWVMEAEEEPVDKILTKHHIE